MNQTTYIEVLGWTQSNSYCLIFFTSGKLNKWTGSKCALGFKASVCSGTQRIWSTESEMESRSGLYGYGLSQGQVEGSVDHVRHLKKGRERTAESIIGSWAEVFPLLQFLPCQGEGQTCIGPHLLSHLLGLSCQGFSPATLSKTEVRESRISSKYGTKIPLANLSPYMKNGPATKPW